MIRTVAGVRTVSASRVFASGVLASAVVLVGGSMLVGAAEAAAAPVPCSTPGLIAAVTAANSAPGGGTVSLANGCTYSLLTADNTADGGTGLPVITGKVAVQGNGATIARSAAAAQHFRVFDVAGGGSLSLDGVTLSNGIADNGAQGGGAVFNHGTLAVSNCRFTNNSNPSLTGNSGGAIENSGTLTLTTSQFAGNSAMEGGGVFNQGTATITESTFTDNTATTYGGGAIVNAFGTTMVDGSTFVHNSGPGGGAIDNDTTITISDSTFVNNVAGGNGGGAVVNFGTATLTTSTLSGNTSTYSGANLYNFSSVSPPVSATLTVSSTIVADGMLPNGQVNSNCGGTPPIVDGGYNIDTGASCGFTATKHSASNTAPQLQPLASNGGPTQTMALVAGSPALDIIPGATAGCAGSTDQRGVARPQGSGCDVGAFELIVPPATSTTVFASPNAAVGVAAVALFANVAPGSATGTVSFSDAGAVLPGCAARPVVAGSANCVTAFGVPGVHQITATYAGDATHGASTGTLALPVAPSGNLFQLALGLLIQFAHNVHLFGF